MVVAEEKDGAEVDEITRMRLVVNNFFNIR